MVGKVSQKNKIEISGLKILKIVIKMGFKTATQSLRRGYRLNNLIFPSKQIYLTIKRINRKIELLYSSDRDDVEEFNAILDKVEEYVDRFKEEYDEVTILETDDSAFNQEFFEIVDFLNEACDIRYDEDLSNKTPKYIKERFDSIAVKLWDAGIRPGEF